jgi:hypothetical protein
MRKMIMSKMIACPNARQYAGTGFARIFIYKAQQGEGKGARDAHQTPNTFTCTEVGLSGGFALCGMSISAPA